MMAEALADVVLATTVSTADADNSRQQTTINNQQQARASRVWRWQRQRWRRGDSGSVRGSGGTSSGLALWRGEAADRTMTKVEAATEAVAAATEAAATKGAGATEAAAATTATEEAVAETAAAQQQQRCNGGGGGGGGRRGGRGDGGNSSGSGDRGSGVGNEGSRGNRGSAAAPSCVMLYCSLERRQEST